MHRFLHSPLAAAVVDTVPDEVGRGNEKVCACMLMYSVNMHSAGWGGKCGRRVHKQRKVSTTARKTARGWRHAASPGHNSREDSKRLAVRSIVPAQQQGRLQGVGGTQHGPVLYAGNKLLDVHTRQRTCIRVFEQPR
eukprot:259375-Chlamydomonas_euryale.AAC.4